MKRKGKTRRGNWIRGKPKREKRSTWEDGAKWTRLEGYSGGRMTKEARRAMQVGWPLLREQLESMSDPGSDWIPAAPRLNAFSLIPCFLHLTLLHWEGDPSKKHGLHPGFALVRFWSVFAQPGNVLSHFRASSSCCSQSIYYLLIKAFFFWLKYKSREKGFVEQTLLRQIGSGIRHFLSCCVMLLCSLCGLQMSFCRI